MGAVVFSQLAEDDLIEIWLTIAADVFYRPMVHGVGIARIVHGARDLASLLMP